VPVISVHTEDLLDSHVLRILQPVDVGERTLTMVPRRTVVWCGVVCEPPVVSTLLHVLEVRTLSRPYFWQVVFAVFENV